VGGDTFVFSAKLGTSKTDRKVNFDTLTDFKVREDKIWLDNAVFKKLGKGLEASPGKLKKDYFYSGTKARDKNDYLVYNKKTGVLFYDADGSGKGAAVEFAIVKKGPSLSYKDFFII
jgi:Ca2+-binding RTX toxin-like protein